MDLFHRLMNTLCPGSIKKINTSGAGFKLMENIVVLQVGVKSHCNPRS